MASKNLLQEVATQIGDYRKGEIDAPNLEHVDNWISQFEEKFRDPILRELEHVLQKTYISERRVGAFLHELASHKDLTNGDPKKFWSEATVLDIQNNGSSQREMRQMFREIVSEEHGVDIDESPDDGAVAIYVDDVVFSGGHVRGDLIRWIERKSPEKVTIYIVALAYHLGGQYYAEQKIMEAAGNAGKDVKLRWMRIYEVEDRRFRINNSDVLRPTVIPDHELTKAYVKELEIQGFPPLLRNPGGIGDAKFFSSEEGRNILEQQFLIKGAEIRSQAPMLNDYQRPLGNMVLKTLGFGAVIATFRNCPNNCPLALWASDPWYPLLPRRTNLR